MNKIIGFKCFKKGIINRYGSKMKLDKMYEIKGMPKFMEQGFHMCKNIEDTLRYFDALNSEVDICTVIGYPTFYEYGDDYNEYYDMYVCQKIVLTELLTREKIISLALQMNEIRIRRFIYGYKLSSEEIKYFLEKFKNNLEIICHIIYMYYDENIYKKPYYEKLNITKQYIKEMI